MRLLLPKRAHRRWRQLIFALIVPVLATKMIMMSIQLDSVIDHADQHPFIGLANQQEPYVSRNHIAQTINDKTRFIQTKNSTSIENSNTQSYSLSKRATKKEKLKVAIYMATHLDEMQTAFLKKCWPRSSQHLPLLRNADLILYTSGHPSQDLLDKLNFRNIQVRKYSEPTINSKNKLNWKQKNRLKQAGAKRAMLDPFPRNNDNNSTSWFSAYDWVVRLNADVLLRSDVWLLETMHNDTVDGIFVTCPLTPTNPSVRKLHTDFYAFRPRAVNHTALWLAHSRIRNAEEHLTLSFQHILTSGRYALVPGTKPNSVVCRTAGLESPVVHNHQALSKCQNFYKT